MAEGSTPKKAGWLNIVVDYGPIAVFFLVYRHYSPSGHDNPIGEVFAVIRSTGSFMVAALPVTLAEQADGQADDLPPAVVTVHLPPADARRPMPYVPGVLLLEGWLDVGPQDEPDGRRSLVRLTLDWPAALAATTSETPP